MGYGWIYPYRIYGFWKRDPVEEFESGKISEEEMLELEKTIPKKSLRLSHEELERFGIESHTACLYTITDAKIVYGVNVGVDEGPTQEDLAKIQKAVATIEHELRIPITTGYHLCVEMNYSFTSDQEKRR